MGPLHADMLRIVLLIAVVNLGFPIVKAQYYHFDGGSISFTVRNDSSGKYWADLDILTGWVFQKGPCGSTCSRADIGRSTIARRQAIEQNTADPLYFGNWSAEYTIRINNTKTTQVTKEVDINPAFHSNAKEVVLRIDAQGKWEQERMTVSIELEHPDSVFYEDIISDGESWHYLNIQPANNYWHLQTKINGQIRGDTGNPNRSPLVYMKPFYRIKLNERNVIHVAVTDPDGDLVKCEMSQFSESGEISKFPLPGLTIHENCTVVIDANAYKHGYHDDAWGAVAITVRDYSRKDITLGGKPFRKYMFRLSAIEAQFLIQVVEHIHPPIFVTPTPEANHRIIVYVGAEWRQKIYAQGNVNRTIHEFIVTGRKQEPLFVTPVQDTDDSSARFVEIRWNTTAADIDSHIVCVTAVDDTGVQSDDERCFIIEIRANIFNQSSTTVLDQPYFIDFPSVQQVVGCAINTTCILPLYVKSTADLKRIHVSKTFYDHTEIEPITSIRYKGATVYKSDLSFIKLHADAGDKVICLIATDIKGRHSVEICIRTTQESPDPCMSNPCNNDGTCVRSDLDPTDYICHCHPNYIGRNCEKGEHCRLMPCQSGKCFITSLTTRFCLCYGTGYGGDSCSIPEDHCHPDPCGGRGVCESVGKGHACKCYPRFTGPNCSTNNCPKESNDAITCGDSSCGSDNCSGNGLCTIGGTCVCSLGFQNRPACDIPCTSTTKADIVFLLDASSSEGQSNFQKQLDFVSRVVDDFDIGPTRVQIGIVTFSDYANLEFYLNQYPDKASVLRAIQQIGYLHGITYTDQALAYARQSMFSKANGGRNDAEKYVIVLTDGASTDPNLTVHEANLLKQQNVNIMAIGVGTSIDKTELDKMATDSKHVFTANSFDSLNTLRNDIKLVTCEATGNIALTEHLAGITFVAPSPYPGSTLVCYFGSVAVPPCMFTVFIATNGATPIVKLDEYSQRSGSISPATEVQYLPGVHKLLSAEVNVTIGSAIGTSVMCLTASDGITSDRLCLHVADTDNPTEWTDSLEAHQANATHKFVAPTANAGSRFSCFTNQRCSLIIHTNIVSNICKQVVSGDEDAFLFPPVKDDGHCSTEMVLLTPIEEEKNICLKASVDPSSQTRCFTFDINAANNDLCVSQPCRNDGYCLQQNTTAFTCICNSGFTGKSCEIDLFPCKSNPCKNGGTCRDDHNITTAAFVCACPDGFIGHDCGIVRRPCEPNPCVHGSCSVQGSYASCQCFAGYTGLHCDRDVFNCHVDRCVHGVCQNLIFSSTCVCDPGYVGQRCETRSP